MRLEEDTGTSKYQLRIRRAVLSALLTSMLILSGISALAVPIKAQTIETLTFKVTSVDIMAGVDAMLQWLVANGMDGFGGAQMPAEAQIVTDSWEKTIMSLVHSTPQRSLGIFWFYPEDPWSFLEGEYGYTPLDFDTWTSLASQSTTVSDWVSMSWPDAVPYWQAQNMMTYPGSDALAELIPPPGSDTDEFYFTIQIDTTQADADGKYRFLFGGLSFLNPSLGTVSDQNEFIGFIDLAPMNPHNPDPVNPAISPLEELKDEIIKLSDDDGEDLKKPAADRKATLLDKINEVIEKINEGDYKGAIKKLEKDIIPKLDNTAKQSWITHDLGLLEIIEPLIDLLETML